MIPAFLVITPLVSTFLALDRIREKSVSGMVVVDASGNPVTIPRGPHGSEQEYKTTAERCFLRR